MQLNLVRSVVVIMDFLGAELARAERAEKMEKMRRLREERSERASVSSRKGKEKEREGSVYVNDGDDDDMGMDGIDGMDGDGMDDTRSLHSIHSSYVATPRPSTSTGSNASPPPPLLTSSSSLSPSLSVTSSPPIPPDSSANTLNRTVLKFNSDHKSLHLRLSPLQSVLRDLEKRLGAGSQDPVSIDNGPGVDAAPFNSGVGSDSGIYSNGHKRDGVTVHSYGYNTSSVKRRPQEFSIRSSTGWKGVLERMLSSFPSSYSPSSSSSNINAANALRERQEREAEKTTRIIVGCMEDMKALWKDPVVRSMLRAREVRLEERGGLSVPYFVYLPV